MSNSPANESEIEDDSGPDLERQTLGLLAGIEAAFTRMIVGVVRFAFVKLPCGLRDVADGLVAWLVPVLGSMARVAIRVARVAVVGAVWLALVVGPLGVSLWWLQPADVTVHLSAALWVVIGLAGSVWGIARRRHAQEETWDRRIGADDGGDEACPDDGGWTSDALSVAEIRRSDAERDPDTEDEEPADDIGRPVRDLREESGQTSWEADPRPFGR
jgi:hypothetical protein